MIETLGTFISRNFRKQFRRVFITTHPYLSGIIAIWLAYCSTLEIRPVALSAIFLPYDTVVFGFTATAIALAIAIPSERFITFLSGIQDGSTPFRDFLFVLAWNGLVHIFSFLSFLPFVFVDNDWSLRADSSSAARLYVAAVLWIQFYSCLQFLVTTLGVYELADLYANYCARERKKTESNGG